MQTELSSPCFLSSGAEALGGSDGGWSLVAGCIWPPLPYSQSFLGSVCEALLPTEPGLWSIQVSPERQGRQAREEGAPAVPRGAARGFNPIWYESCSPASGAGRTDKHCEGQGRSRLWLTLLWGALEE